MSESPNDPGSIDGVARLKTAIPALIVNTVTQAAAFPEYGRA